MHRLSSLRNHQCIPKDDHIIYLLRKDNTSLSRVADILNDSDKSSLSRTSLVFVPQKCESCIRYLKFHKVTVDKLHSIDEIPIGLFVMDTDLLTIANIDIFKDIHLHKDYSCIKIIVDSLMMIQDLYGPIPVISGQGECAQLVLKQLVRQRKLQHAKEDSYYNGQNLSKSFTLHASSDTKKISHLLLIDRKIDLLTPLLTQLTYEGIIDEVLGIDHGKVVLVDKKVHRLHSSEELFSKLRDSHVNAVAHTLKQTARSLQAEFDKSQEKAKTVQEMHKIVQRIPFLKKAKESHANHLTIAEVISKRTLEPEFIYGLRIEHELLQQGRITKIIPELETKLMRQENPLSIMRLICAHSLTSNGLRTKVSEFYKREIIQNAGFDYIQFINDLKAVELFLDQEKELDLFSSLRTRYNLVNEDVNELNPDHPSYVYGGYLPYTIHLARMLTKHESSRLSEPGFTYTDMALTNNQYNIYSTIASPGSLPKQAQDRKEKRTILVYFIGGCTYAEISALRYLGRQEENNCDFIVATTSIINGNSFLKSLVPSSV